MGIVKVKEIVTKTDKSINNSVEKRKTNVNFTTNFTINFQNNIGRGSSNVQDASIKEAYSRMSMGNEYLKNSVLNGAEEVESTIL